MPRKPKMPPEVELEAGSVKAYCVKCRVKNTKMNEPVLRHTLVNGRLKPMVQGVHKKCGTKMTKFVGQDFVDDVMAQV